MKNYRANLVIQGSFWIAAILVGVIGVYFLKLVGVVQENYSYFFHAHPYWSLLLTPLFIFLGAAVIRIAPMATGSGVPQVLYASMLAQKSQRDPTENELVSARTSVIKVISTVLGFVGGASIGSEGPMVQISTSVFAEIARRMKKILPRIDFRSYIAAGAGTGIAAAFNAPLGGIAFALEEVATSEFGNLRHLVLLAIIVAGLTTDALVGTDQYFGTPDLGLNQARYAGWAIVIGIIGGLLGAFFGKLVTSDRLRGMGKTWWKKALIFGVLVAVLNFVFDGETGGSGYYVTRNLFSGAPVSLPIVFPIAKCMATAFSTLTGMGGGILAPSLSTGAWMGVSTGKMIAFANLKVCALLGMVAYFSGAFQIPITSVIVVMEITNQHEIIFPMMIAALTAFIVARIFMPTSLYHLLIQKTFNYVHPESAVV